MELAIGAIRQEMSEDDLTADELIARRDTFADDKNVRLDTKMSLAGGEPLVLSF